MGECSKVELFKLANAASPIVMSEWLDAEHRSPNGPPETWVCRRIRLADGTTFLFEPHEVKHLPKYEDTHWAA